MPPIYLRLFLTLIIYLSVCVFIFAFVEPYSFISFIGPAAGITTALVVFWGPSILFAIAAATIIFCLFLYFWVNLPIELSMVIIALLTLILQGFWAKHLTLIEVDKQNWLKSRRNLLTFLFKVGPVISLVSASTVVILTILESREFGNNLFFVFASCWSSSVLFSIFFTPLFLLSQGRHQLSSSKRFFITIASLLALITIGLLLNIYHNIQQHQRQDRFEKVQNKVVQEIQQEVALTIEQLNSLSAFFKAKKQVSRREFDLFSQHIFQQKSSVRVLQWAPVVNHENSAEFIEYFGDINEKNINGKLQKANIRKFYAPIKYIYPSLGNRQVIGLDVLSNSKNIIDMEKVISQGGIIASAPISLIQDNYENLGVLFATAVFDGLASASNAKSDIQKQEDKGRLLGFIIAVVQFERFFEQISPLQADSIALFIEDITAQEPYVLFGKQLNENFRHHVSTFLYVNSRKWRISVGESHTWQMQEKNWQVWGMLFGVTLGGGLFQILILMMAVYSNELSVQVVRKTRELIIAKEESDHKNMAKTNFLYTLINELQAPLEAIANFTKQLQQADSQEQKILIHQIGLAKGNMDKLLLMVADLSKIELGELAVYKEPLDFYGFLDRIESMLKVSKLNKNNSITLLIDPSVPYFINSDELKIQQFLMAFCGGVHKLFGVENIRLSIKVHNHQYSSATLLFVFTNQDNESDNSTKQLQHFISKDLSLYSAEMAMAKEVCQLLEGDANLAISASGERVLTASIKIDITSNEQQRAYQAQTFDEKDNFK